MITNMSNALITGFPGFLSKNIIKELRHQNRYSAIYVLVLPNLVQKAEQVISEIYEDGITNQSIIVVKGDITLSNAGLDNETINNLKQEINDVWHLAAIYDLAVPKEIAWKVNVEGTKLFNELVLKLPNIKRYMYFSTAYVAGKREGKLLETELIKPPGFKNHYEETKYEAEVLVNNLKSQLPLTIIRPGIVRGHSITGETIKFDGPYFFINMINRLKRLPIIPYLGKSTSFINVVPSDYITKASIYCCFDEEAEGKTIHLTDPKPYPVEEVYRAFVREVTGKYPKGRIPLALAKGSVSLLPIRKFLQVEKETLDYLTWNSSFDTTNAEKILRKGEINCPDFIDSIPSMVRFYNKHKDDPTYHISIK